MASLSRRAWRFLGLPIGLLLGLAAAVSGGSSIGTRMEALTLDARLSLVGQRPLDPRVVIVDVDDETLGLLGWPIPRGFYAQLIQTVRKHGARAIGFDILFLEASNDENDALLARAARDCHCVVFPSQIRPGDDGALRVEPPIAPLRESSAADAHVQLDNAVDGVFRRVPLVLEAGGRSWPAFAVALARVAGAPAAVDELTAARSSVWLNWRATRSDDVGALSLLDVLAAEEAIANGEKPGIDLDAKFGNAIVVVGQSARSVGDRGALPSSVDAPLLLAHATLIDNVIRDRLLEPPPAGLVVLLALLLCAGVGTAVTAMRIWASAASVGATLALYWSLAVWAFTAEVWLPLAAPTAGAALVFVVCSAVNLWGRDEEEKRLRQAFERYVAPHILEKILQGADGVDIRGHRRTLTLMFSDIKGYTTLSNTLPPDQIVELLCTYLDTMVEILLVHEGTVDKIMGDGIMAFFGDPLPQQDHALRCIKAALAMQQATTKLGEQWVAQGLSPLQVRIGVSTGEVFVGAIGSRHHLEYTAIGRPVNLAARLEGKAPPGGVLVAAETWALVKEHVEGREVRGLDLKGYSAGYDAWLVTGLKGQGGERSRAEQRTTQRQSFFSDVTLQFQGVDVTARSSDISPGGMFLHCDMLPPLRSTVRVKASLSTPPSTVLAVTMDAVVTHVREGKDGAGGVGLMFTSVFADDRSAIRALLERVLGDDQYEDGRVLEAQGPARWSYALDPSLPDEAEDDELPA